MILDIGFRSAALKSQTQLSVIMPSEDASVAPTKTLWLLHGLSGNNRSWLNGSSIERYAKARGLAVVMPDAGRSWYTNTAYGINYFDFVTKEAWELYHKTFKGTSESREDNIIAGLSMGGYGALKLALSCPEQYGSCISLSGSLDITRRGRACDLDEWRGIFGFDLKSPFDLEGGEHDLYALTRKRAAEGLVFPKIYMWCGTEDVLIGLNRDYDALLTELGVEHRFEFSEGNHSWGYWDMHIQGALDYILN